MMYSIIFGLALLFTNLSLFMSVVIIARLKTAGNKYTVVSSVIDIIACILWSIYHYMSN